MSKLTLIMPVYNGEATVGQALSSVVALQESAQIPLSCLVVDDQSVDASAEILRRWESQYPFIKMLQMPVNSGPGPARNLALEQIEDGYVGFIDSDDEIIPAGYLNCLDYGLSNDNDFVTFNGRIIQDDRITQKYDFGRIENDTQAMVRRALRSELDGSVIFSLYRKDLIARAQLHFLDDFYEDIPFSQLGLIQAERRAIINVEAYQKTGTPDSIVNSVSQKHVTGLFAAFSTVYNRLKCVGLLYKDHEPDFAYGAHGYIAKAVVDVVCSNKHNTVEKLTLLELIWHEISCQPLFNSLPKLTKTRKDTICTMMRRYGEEQAINDNALAELVLLASEGR